MKIQRFGEYYNNENLLDDIKFICNSLGLIVRKVDKKYGNIMQLCSLNQSN